MKGIGLVFAIFALGMPTSSWASPAITAKTHITYLESGWSGEGLGFNTTSGLSGCTVGDNYLGILATNPLYDILVSMVLTAYSTGATIEVVGD